MDVTQTFWDLFRERWRERLVSWEAIVEDKDGRAVTDAWTELIKSAAEDACLDLARQMGRHVHVGRERHGRIDVYAEDVNSGKLLVAFESELARWGYNGASGKDWRQEFHKLCYTSAELRVLSSTFANYSGNEFPDFLRQKLDELKSSFIRESAGAFCLIFGPERVEVDHEQHWLAYSLETDYTLRELTSATPLRPKFVIHPVKD